MNTTLDKHPKDFLPMDLNVKLITFLRSKKIPTSLQIIFSNVVAKICDIHSTRPMREDGSFIHYVLRTPVYLIEIGVTDYNMILASLFCDITDKKIVQEILDSFVYKDIDKLKKLIELTSEKEYSQTVDGAVGRGVLKMDNLIEAVQTSTEAGIIKYARYFNDRIDFEKAEKQAKIAWAQENKDQINVFLGSLHPKLGNVSFAQSFNLKEFFTTLMEDSKFIKETLKLVR